MKITIAFLFIAFIAVQTTAQDFLGTWSFEKLDPDAIPEDAKPETIAMLSNIFGSLKIDFKDGAAFMIELMGQEQEGIYEVEEDIVTLAGASTFQLINANQGLYKDGKAQVLMSRGIASNAVKTYLHLTEQDYQPIDFDTSKLIGNWKTVEVKGAETEQSAELTETLLSSLNLVFEESGDLSFTVFGITQEQTWNKGSEKGVLIIGEQTAEPKTYFLHLLNESELILELEATGTLVYLKRVEE